MSNVSFHIKYMLIFEKLGVFQQNDPRWKKYPNFEEVMLWNAKTPKQLIRSVGITLEELHKMQ